MSAVFVEQAAAEDWNCCECADDDSETNEVNEFVAAEEDCWLEEDDLELGGGGNNIPIPPLDFGFCLAIELVSVFF